MVVFFGSNKVILVNWNVRVECQFGFWICGGHGSIMKGGEGVMNGDGYLFFPLLASRTPRCGNNNKLHQADSESCREPVWILHNNMDINPMKENKDKRGHRSLPRSMCSLSRKKLKTRIARQPSSSTSEIQETRRKRHQQEFFKWHEHVDCLLWKAPNQVQVQVQRLCGCHTMCRSNISRALDIGVGVEKLRGRQSSGTKRDWKSSW